MTKKYKITVDGTAYTVEVEDLGAGAPAAAPAPVPAAAPAPVAPAAAPAPIPAAAPAAAPAPAPAAGVPVAAPMPGKILRVAVSVGAPVKNGDLVLILEAMKMENEIFSPADGVVKEIRARDGETVNTGDVMMIIG
ncbi:MAG: glutaconyl-CoA/methylmalonyl-CoA decarboxylase subunit gamma [Synergistaceae bacterium]|nr:glutaconyl-CoA/methylmalonyl-CoA decarboxylase subunit gamma [Synergistaceae bacterium]